MKTRIFYDGNCIVCDMEIAHYKRIASEIFELEDISAPGFDARHFHLTAKDVERDLHVLTPEGELRIGVDAFAHIWSRIGKYKFLARLIRLPVVYQAAKAGYKFFTLVRPYLPKKVRR